MKSDVNKTKSSTKNGKMLGIGLPWTEVTLIRLLFKCITLPISSHGGLETPRYIIFEGFRTSNNRKRENWYYSKLLFYPVNRPTNHAQTPRAALAVLKWIFPKKKKKFPPSHVRDLFPIIRKLYYASSHFTIEYACMMWSASSETAIQLLLAQVPYDIWKNTSMVEVSQFHLEMQPK